MAEVVWIFDYPFVEDDWPLPHELQNKMLHIVINAADEAGTPFAEGCELVVTKLKYYGGEGIPLHPELDNQLWRLPGVVRLDPGDDKEALRGTNIPSNPIEQKTPPNP